MFPGIRLTKSGARLLPKRCPFLGGEKRFRHVDPSVRWSYCLAPPPKESFQVPVFICFNIFLRGGSKSIIVYRLARGMECIVVRSGTQQFDLPVERASWYALPGGHLLFIRSNFWLRSLRSAPQITWFTVKGYPPWVLSDKISTSQLLPWLTLRLLAPQPEHVFCLALTSPARPPITALCTTMIPVPFTELLPGQLFSALCICATCSSCLQVAHGSCSEENVPCLNCTVSSLGLKYLGLGSYHLTALLGQCSPSRRPLRRILKNTAQRTVLWIPLQCILPT